MVTASPNTHLANEIKPICNLGYFFMLYSNTNNQIKNKSGCYASEVSDS